MEIQHALFLGLLQGFTEFLPISSSAHLILVPIFFHWPDQGLAFDIALHVGTLTAVISYFFREIKDILVDWCKSFSKDHPPTANSRLGWSIIIATLPLVVMGFLLSDVIETLFRSTLVIAATTIIFALFLWWSYYRDKGTKTEYTLSYVDAFIIGIAQAIALVPGTSRSGITLTAGLFRNLNPIAAVRFSFLMSIPAILLSGAYKILQIFANHLTVDWQAIVVGATVSGVTAYLTIHFFIKLVDRIGLLPFIIYRLILGAGLLYLHFNGGL